MHVIKETWSRILLPCRDMSFGETDSRVMDRERLLLATACSAIICKIEKGHYSLKPTLVCFYSKTEKQSARAPSVWAEIRAQITSHPPSINAI